MELYVSRHGETVSNIEQRLTGKDLDSPLTEKGKEQAAQLGKYLEDKKFDAVYCSPLKRAFDTAKIALGDNYKFCVDDRLAEIGLGVMDGMTYAEASAVYPKSGMLFFTDPVSYLPPPNGEQINDVIKRIGLFLDDITKAEHKKVFVLTHGYLMRVLYSCTCDKSILTIATSPRYSNCDVAHYIYEGCNWTIS